jgi:catechol 2,3-dioxygenase-like lactoylglutathione lyase family enzyme
MIFDHIGFNVGDFAKSKAFYCQTLAPLGVEIVMSGDNWAMLGKNGKPAFWFGAYGPKPGRIHLAFAAENRAQVRAFYDVAIAAGGTDNGAPGVREQYHPSYYGAFVIDPDGHNVEAVCHLPENRV